MIITVMLTTFVRSDEELNLREQDPNLDPNIQDSAKESQRLSTNDKRTIFNNLVNQNNYALARHFVYRNGMKYLLGYGQVDLRYMPYFRPVFNKPRVTVPWYPATNKPTVTVKPVVVPVKPPIFSHPSIVHSKEPWKPIGTTVIPSKPAAWDGQIHVPTTAPEGHGHHPIHLHPIKLNLPVLPFGAMFLTPVLPQQNHNQHLEYYPLPVQSAVINQPIHTHNPHPYIESIKPVVSNPSHHHHPHNHVQPVVPGGSYEIHGYHPHNHVTFIPPPVKPAYEIHQEAPHAYHQEIPAEIPQYSIEDHASNSPELTTSVAQHSSQPYVGSLEFHGKQYQYPSFEEQQQYNVIQPGQTDVQIPLHLAHHPNYRPEDYYLGETGQYQGHIAGERSDKALENKPPFKPSQRIYTYKNA